jgi:hypothetical protein
MIVRAEPRRRAQSTRPRRAASATLAIGALATLVAWGCTDSSYGVDAPPVSPVDAASPDASSEAALVDASVEAAVDAGPSWQLHSFDYYADAWSSVALATIWTGPNAPPPRGIAAATELMDVDRLMILSDDGTYYVRANGAWQPPQRGGDAWPLLPTTVDSIYNLGHKFWVTQDPTAPLEEKITFISGSQAYIYRFVYNADPAKDAIVFDSQVSTKDTDGGAPQASQKCVWNFEVLDLQNAKPEERAVLYAAYTDGSFWGFNAYLQWTPMLPADCPLWVGRPGAPDFSTIRAAFYSQGSRSVRLVGP